MIETLLCFHPTSPESRVIGIRFTQNRQNFVLSGMCLVHLEEPLHSL